MSNLKNIIQFLVTYISSFNYTISSKKTRNAKLTNVEYLSYSKPAVYTYFRPRLSVFYRQRDVTGWDTTWRGGVVLICSYIEYAAATRGSRKATTNAIRPQSTINNVSFARYRRTCRGNDSRFTIWAYSLSSFDGPFRGFIVKLLHF